MLPLSRRRFLGECLRGSAAFTLSGLMSRTARSGRDEPTARMRFGLVTWQWGRDWDLPALITHCEKAEVFGVELRTTHAHKVEPDLNPRRRREVKRRFADSPVTHVGIGSNERFDHPDPAALQQAVEATKGFVKLSHDTGGSGVKVKPNNFHTHVPREKTIEQIGRSLNEVGRFASDYGQQIRLEVHGASQWMTSHWSFSRRPKTSSRSGPNRATDMNGDMPSDC